MEQMDSLAQAVKQLKDNAQCPICFDILVDPISTKCNHHFCSSCHKKLFKNSSKLSCPVCHASLTRRACVKSSSLNDIVQAINSLIKSLIEDTGIDFSNEHSVLASSREATRKNEHSVPASAREATRINKQSEPVHSSEAKRRDNPLQRGHQFTDTLEDEKKTHRLIEDVPKTCTEGKNFPETSSGTRKIIKHYKGKRENIAPDDSFMFPADFILPKKKDALRNKVSIEPVVSKVSSWLTKNENNLNDLEEMSILNGSLPKKVSPDLSVSLSDEELLSVSQVNTNTNVCLPAKKSKMEIILENVDEVDAKDTEFKDPYEFISSQKSNDAKKLVKSIKRHSKSYQKKLKPIGLDISQLVQETYAKKRKLNDFSFLPPQINDTFDQLISFVKKPENKLQFNTHTKHATQNNDDGEILIFQSQNKNDTPSNSLTDFSSGSDEEWGNTRKNKIKPCGRKSVKVFKEQPIKQKGRRKSNVVLKTNKIDNEGAIEDLNKTHQEIENYQLITSSQVMREQMLEKRVEKENDSCERNQHFGTASPKKNETRSTENIKFSGKNSIKGDANHSPGWQRANLFARDFKNVHFHQSVNEPRKKLVISRNSKLSNEPESSHNDISVLKGNCFANDGNNTLTERHIPCPNQNLKKNESIEEKNILISQCEPLRINSSPEEPVRYLNLSQSVERAKIMNEVVKSLESTLKKAAIVGSTGKDNLYVSVDDSLDEVDVSVLQSATKQDVVSEELANTKDKSPLSVTMVSETKKVADKIKENSTKTVGERSILTNDMFEILEEEVQCPETQKRNSCVCSPRVLEDRLQNAQSDQKLEVFQEKSNELSKIDSPAKDEEKNPKKTILVCTPSKTRTSPCNDEILYDESEQRDKEVHKEQICEPSAELNGGSRMGVVFLKLGKCSFPNRKGKVKFVFLGSCMTASEKCAAVTQRMIEISKGCPVCCCGKHKSISSKPPQDSVTEIEASNNLFAPHLSVQENILCNSCDERLSEDKLKCNDMLVEGDASDSNGGDVEENVSDTLKSSNACDVDAGCPKVNHKKLQEIIKSSEELDKEYDRKKISNEKEIIKKISDEDIFSSGQNNENISPMFEEKINEDIGYQLTSSFEILPPNVAMPSAVCHTNSEDIFLTCQGKDVNSSAIELNLSSTKKSIIEKSAQEACSKNNNNFNCVKLSCTDKIAVKTAESRFKLKSGVCAPIDDLKENDEINKLCSNLCMAEVNNSFNTFNTEKGFEVVECKPNTGQDIFASDESNSFQDRISSKPLPYSFTQKGVRPLSPYSSNEKSLDEKTVKRPCTETDIEHKNDCKFPSPGASSVIISKDVDEDLNSEELLQRVMDNINKDIGHNPRKLKGAKRKISSDSEEEIEDYKMTDKKLSKSTEYQNQINKCLDEDIFEDETENDVDVIEDSPMKSKFAVYAGDKSTGNKCLRENDNEQDEKLSLISSSKFILPHSSFSNKKLQVCFKSNDLPSTSSSCEQNKSVKTESNQNKSSAVVCNLFGSQSKTSVVRSSPILDVENSSRNRTRQQTCTNKSGPSVLNTGQNFDSNSKLLFVCSSLSPSLVNKVKKFAQIFGANFSEQFCIGMTHLIVNVDENRTTPKTLKYLQAVAAKKWIVSYGWVLACVSAKKLVPEEPYEALDTLSGLDGPRRSRLSTISLFKDVQICFIEPFQSISLEKIVDLFMMCGGMVVDSPEAFAVTNRDVIRIITSDMEDEDVDSLCLKWLKKHRAAAVLSDWVLDSIGTHQLQPLATYLLGHYSQDQLLSCGIPEILLDDEDLESTAASDFSEII